MKSPDLKSLLLATRASRMALVRRGLETLPHPSSDSTRRALREAGLRATRELADIDILLSLEAGPPVPFDLPDLVSRALRLCEPVFLTTRTQVIFEMAPRLVPARGHAARLLGALVLTLRDGCSGEAGTLKLSLGADKAFERPWLWLSQEGPRGADDAAYPLSAEASTWLEEAEVGVEFVDLAQSGVAGVRALRLRLPTHAPTRAEASPAPAATPFVPRARFSGPLPAPLAMPGKPIVPAAPSPPPASLPESLGAAATPAVPAVPVVSSPSPSPSPEAPSVEQVLGRVNALASEALDEFYNERAAPRRILVVDDEEGLLALFAAILPTIGVEFELAASAERALELVRPGRFSLVITDKNLPGMSGLELLKALVAVDPRLGGVMITGYTSAHAISEALELGVYDYLDKPFPELPVLLARLDMALHRHRLHARVMALTEKLSTLAALLPAGRDLPDPRLKRVQELLNKVPEPLRIVTLCPTDVIASLSGESPFGMGASTTGVTQEPLVDAVALHRVLEGGRKPDLVVVEPRLYNRAIGELVSACRGAEPPLPQVFVATRDESLQLAMDAVGAGVADYVLVSQATPDQVRQRFSQAVERLRLQRRDRAVILDLLSIDIDRLAQERPEAPGAADVAGFEPQLGGSGT